MSPTKKIRVIAIEPSEIVAAGIVHILGNASGFALPSHLPDATLLQRARAEAYDVVLLDPAAVAAHQRSNVRRALDLEPSMPIVGLLTDAAMMADTSQYDATVTLSDDADVLIDRIRSAVAQERKEPKGNGSRLSSRECDILKAVALGHTNKEIADELHLSVNTVVTHRRNISHKLGINTIPGLTAYAIINKIIDIDSL